MLPMLPKLWAKVFTHTGLIQSNWKNPTLCSDTNCVDIILTHSSLDFVWKTQAKLKSPVDAYMSPVAFCPLPCYQSSVNNTPSEPLEYLALHSVHECRHQYKVILLSQQCLQQQITPGDITWHSHRPHSIDLSCLTFENWSSNDEIITAAD